MVRAIPILPCRDLDETLAFYGGLGFALDFEERQPLAYAIVSLGEAEIHLERVEGLAPQAARHACYLEVGNADALFAHWRGAGFAAEGVPRLEPIADRPWGMREFALVDPNGNRLRVGHRLA